MTESRPAPPLWALALLFILAAPLASAAPAGRAPRPVTLLRFRGPNAEAVQRAVAKGLEKQRGLTLVSLPNKKAREGAELELAKQAGAVCAVSGTVEPGRFRVVNLRVVTVPDGQVLQEVSLSAPGARGLKQLPKLVSKRLADGLERCRALPLPGDAPSVAANPDPAPPKAEPAPSVAPPAAAEAAPTPAPSRPKPKSAAVATAPAPEPAPTARTPSPPDTPPSEALLLDASIGASSVMRFLSYSDDLFSALPGYQLPGSPAGSLRVDAYPGARRGGALSRLGLTVSAEQSFLLRSGTRGGPSFSTNAQRITFGLLGRLPVSAVELTLNAAYGWQEFSIDGEGEPGRPVLPNVTYRFLRAGAGVRAGVTPRIAVLGNAAYLHILDSGQIATSAYFPRLSVGGVEAGVGAAWQFSSPWEVRVGVDYRRYFFSMHPEPGDPFIAGGALDQYLVGTLALGVRLR